MNDRPSYFWLCFWLYMIVLALICIDIDVMHATTALKNPQQCSQPAEKKP